jgi:predicted amidophosphoribosyltransferase
MYCNDCGNKIMSWQEYCDRCGADLFKKKPGRSTEKHSFFARFFLSDQINN